MITLPKRSDLLTLYAEGVDAIESIGADLDADTNGRGWHRTAVGDWTAQELARHLLGVARWYHQWLDDAELGRAEPPFPVKQLEGRNELDVLDATALSGREALDTFLLEARRYLTRLEAAASSDEAWNRPFGFPWGTITTGLHVGAAISEWNLHAWDLSSGTWEPSDPEAVYLAVGAALTAPQPRLQRLVTHRVVPVLARRNPWPDLLKRSGRRV